MNGEKVMEEQSKEKSKEQIKEERNAKILKAAFLITIIFLAITIYALLDKNNMYHMDINNPNLIKTEHGYKEELVIEETTIIKKYIKKHKPQGQKITRTTYNVMYYNEELKDNVAVNVGKNKYDEFNVGDKVKATRTVYYTKDGLRIDYEDSIEKIED